ncbi:MAG TPA: TonB-dependent receptor, partial [Anseongella sp.]|nr:TonB-dependent receptor [Anseongella sp.]
TDRYFTEDDPQELFDAQEGLQTGNFVYGPGDIKFKDLNGDGVINGGATTLSDHGDLKVIGNTQPRYQYGARIGGAWKNLDFDIFIQGVGKRDLWGAGDIALPLYRGGDILYEHQLDYWTEGNPDAYYPRHFVGNNSGNVSGLDAGGHNFYPQSKYLLNLAYCRLKNVTVGYSFSPDLLKRANLRNVRLYISGENLAELSDVGVPLDPEITDGQLGFLGRTFPFQRRFSFGLQITL